MALYVRVTIYNLDIQSQDNFFSIDENVFYYDSKEKIKIIDKDGNINDEIATEKKITEYKTTYISSAGSLIDKKKIINFTEKNRILLINNEFLTANYQKYEKIRKFKKANDLQMKNTIPKNNIDLDTIALSIFLGVDSENNQYWRGSLSNDWKIELLAVFSSSGELLDCFYIPRLVVYVSTPTALAPNGDIYLMQSLETGISFYKITRRW